MPKKDELFIERREQGDYARASSWFEPRQRRVADPG
jgi:hypothetical protein